MTAPMIPDNTMPDKPWHEQKTPEEWQAINKKATQDFHASLAANPHNPDREALQAIKDSNDALNAYDQPAITAGSHVLPTGYGDPVEALKGEARGVAGAIGAPFHLANTMYRQGAGAGVDELLHGLTSIPGEIASGDPERIGEVAGNVAGGIAMGKLGGKLAKGAKGVITEYAERPALKNALLKAQTASAQNSLNRPTPETPDWVAEQARLRTDLMRQNLEQKTQLHPDKVEQAGLKTNQMHQSVAEKAGTLHQDVQTPKLRNDLIRLQIEKLQKALEEGNDENPEGPAAEGAPLPPKPPTNAPSTSNPTAQTAKDEFMRSDPYGLNDPANAPPPPDILDNFIQSLKARTGDPNPVSEFDRRGNEAPPPLSPEALNELLNQIRKNPPKG